EYKQPYWDNGYIYAEEENSQDTSNWFEGISKVGAKNITLIANGDIGSSTDIQDIEKGYLDISWWGGDGNLNITSQADDVYINLVNSNNWLTNSVSVQAADNQLAVIGCSGNINEQGELTLYDTGYAGMNFNDNADLILAARGNLKIESPLSINKDLELYAAGDVIINNNISNNNTDNDITIGADFHSDYWNEGGEGSGAIIQNSGAINASELILSAGSGIGINFDQNNQVYDDSLQTRVSYLQATNTTSGNINIINTGDLTADSVVNDTDGGEVNIAVNSGDLTVGSILSETVNLTAAGSILDDGLDINGDSENLAAPGFPGYTRISAKNITLITQGDIGSSGADDIGIEFLDLALEPQGSLTLDTHSVPSGKGNIYINETSLSNLNSSQINIQGIPDEAEMILVNSEGDLTIDSDVGSEIEPIGFRLIWVAHNINLNKDIYTDYDLFLGAFDNITLDGNIIGATGSEANESAIDLKANVTSDALGITDEKGKITYESGVISALWSTLSAAEGIGTETNPVHLNLEMIGDVRNTNTGGIYLINDGNLTTHGTFEGDYISLETSGNLHLDKRDDNNPNIIQSAGTVLLESTNGYISMLNITPELRINGNNLILKAKGGIGSKDEPINAIINYLQATNTNNGIINIANTGDLTADSVENSGGDIILSVNSGDLTVGSIKAVNNTVTFNLSGRVLDDSGNDTYIWTKDLIINNANSIGGSGADEGLDTKISSLEINTAGDVYVREIQDGGALTLHNIKGKNVNISTTNGNLSLPADYTISASGDTVLTSSGNLTLNGSIDASSHIVNLSAGQDIVDTSDNATRITADTLNITSVRNVGGAGSNKELDIDVNTLNINNVSGDVYIKESNNVGLNSLDVAGNTTLTGLNINIINDIILNTLLTVNGTLGLDTSGKTFDASAGSIDLNGDFNLSNGTFNAPSGNFNIEGDFNHTAGTFNNNSGTVTFDGTTTQTLNNGASGFYNLTHSGAGTLQLANTLTVDNNLTNSAGTFDADGH
ncbi:MAG: hypothetical protein DRH44_08370, partial [Candidatus Coatesbacteria bacterium]